MNENTSVVRSGDLMIGLDVGGTKTEAVAVDSDRQILSRVRLPTEPGPRGVVRTVHQAIDCLRGKTGMGTPRSVGIGIPGQIDMTGGRVRYAVNLNLEDLDLRGVLEQELGVSVRIENDVKAAALGACFLRGHVEETIGYLNLGTGVAAGVVIEGKLWRGASGAAGEIGHFSIDPNGTLCGCGQRGCIETYAGGLALSRRWGNSGGIAAKEIFDAAANGDTHAITLRADLARGVAEAVQLLVLTIDVPTVVLGGGISALGERLLTVVREELRLTASSSSFLRSLNVEERIEVLPPGSDAAAFGAALVGLTNEGLRSFSLPGPSAD